MDARKSDPVRQRRRDRRVILDLLRDIRREAGLTQTELARKLGRTQAYVSKYELGERRLDLMDLFAVCDAVEISPVEFVQRVLQRRHKLAGRT